MFGVAPGAPMDFEDFFIHVHRDDRARVVGAIAQALSGAGELDLVHRIVRPDGNVRWLQTIATTRFRKDGVLTRPWQTRGMMCDVTTQKENRHEPT